jgi:hypothetical protein
VGSFLFQLFGRYFWAIAIVMSLVNYMIGRRRLADASGFNEIQRSDAQGLLVRLYLFSSLPWLVMGWGVLYGGVPSVFNYLRPLDHNPYVTYWYGSLFLLAIINALWVLLANGAVRTRELQEWGVFGARQKNAITPEWVVKLLAVLGPIFVLIWIYWIQFIAAQKLPH